MDKSNIKVIKQDKIEGSHSEKIQKIFSHTYSEELWVSVSELSEIENFQSFHDWTRVAKLDVLTREMLDYDKQHLSEGNLEDYRPYFYSYIIYFNSELDIERYNKLVRMGDGWYQAKFLHNNRSNSNNLSADEFFGEIESSASPIQYAKKSMIISDTTLPANIVKEINDTYNKVAAVSTDAVVDTILHNVFDHVHFSSSRVFRVGNGNLIQIHGIKEDTPFDMMYDVGYHYRQHPGDKRNLYGHAVKAFHSIHPQVVMLSHWDDDHIMGCVYAQDELFECPWIAPEIVKLQAIGAKRLASYLSVKKKLTIVRRDVKARKLSEVICDNSKIMIYLGENMKQDNITQENCGGMVIEIVNETGTAESKNNKITEKTKKAKKTKKAENIKVTENLFCGDVPYSAIDTEIWNVRSKGYDNLVVPHHGSNMTYTALKRVAKGKAIVCGDNDVNCKHVTAKKRPSDSHRNDLIKKGYDVCVTEDAKKHSWINLKLD